MIDALVKLSGSIFVAGVGLLALILSLLAIAIIVSTVNDYIKQK